MRNGEHSRAIETILLQQNIHAGKEDYTKANAQAFNNKRGILVPRQINAGSPGYAARYVTWFLVSFSSSVSSLIGLLTSFPALNILIPQRHPIPSPFQSFLAKPPQLLDVCVAVAL